MTIVDNILEASIYCIICILKARLFKKNIRNLTWYLFNSLLFFASSLFFYFELICELLLAAKWVSRDGMLMDLIGLRSTLFWNKKSQYALMGHSIIGKALLPGSNHNHLATPYILKEHYWEITWFLSSMISTVSFGFIYIFFCPGLLISCIL